MLNFTSFCVAVTLLPSNVVRGATKMEILRGDERESGNENTVAGETIFQAYLRRNDMETGRLSTQITLANYFIFMAGILNCVCLPGEVGYPIQHNFRSLRNYPADIRTLWYRRVEEFSSQASWATGASWVDSYSRQKAFIASQAPQEYAEEISFWNMIWTNNVRIIVMLTSIHEDGATKSTQYWPDSADRVIEFDAYKVTIVTVDDDEVGYTCSHLKLSKTTIDEFREVTHCQFKNWPDMRQPTDTEQLLAFMRYIKVLESKAEVSDATTQAPILIHCKAGLGRTGTYIAIDVLIERMESESGHWVDVAGVVERLRVQRPRAVLTDAQYYFCAIALRAYMCKNHKVSGCVFCAAELEVRSDTAIEENIVVPGEETGFSIFQRYFCGHLQPARCVTGEQGRRSTRRAVLDFFTGCCTLRSIDHDYIWEDSAELRTDVREFSGRANWVDSYYRKSAFIVSETPQNNDEFAFWDMIWRNSVRVIVMLNRPGSAQYWPTYDHKISGSDIVTSEIQELSYTVTVLGDFFDSEEYKCTRILLVNKLNLDEGRVIRHCVFNWWPENSTPTHTDNFLEFKKIISFLAVAKKRIQCDSANSNRLPVRTVRTPIVLLCTNARDRVATFVTIDVLIERAGVEDSVGLPAFVRLVNLQLPLRCTMNTSQYDYCRRQFMLKKVHETVENRDPGGRRE